MNNNFKKQIYTSIRNLISDLAEYPTVDFVQFFKIKLTEKSLNISLKTLVTCILTGFISPCQNPCDKKIKDRYLGASFESFVLNDSTIETLRIHNNGLEFLLCFSIKENNEYYFFLYRQKDKYISDGTNIVGIPFRSVLDQSDPKIYSFQIFCEVNDLEIQSLKVPNKPKPNPEAFFSIVSQWDNYFFIHSEIEYTIGPGYIDVRKGVIERGNIDKKDCNSVLAILEQRNISVDYCEIENIWFFTNPKVSLDLSYMHK